MTKLNELAVADLLAGYRSKEFSPVDVMEAVIAQVTACEPEINATYAFDPTSALAEARASQERWARNEPKTLAGATLDGVPATLKEVIPTKGVPVPFGTLANDLVPSTYDALPAERLKEAGAIIFSKTTAPDLSMLSSGLSRFHGVTRNPWNTAKNTGGSSSGAGAAAAAGYGPLHMGTDIGGSVRFPATWCGVVGLKPSFGRIPMLMPYLGRVAGPITRTVADTAYMMSVVSQPDPQERDATSLPPQDIDWLSLESEIKGLRIGLLLDADGGIPTHPDVRAAVENAGRLFEAAGAIVEPITAWMTESQMRGWDSFFRMRSGADVAKMSEERKAKLLPIIREWAESGLEVSGPQLFQYYTDMVDTIRATVAATQPYDFVLSPTAPNAGWPAEWPYPTNDVATSNDHIGFTVPFNLSGQPAVSINCGYDRTGVPIGLQIAGHRYDDLGVLRLARAWELIRPAHRAWPTAPFHRSEEQP